MTNPTYAQVLHAAMCADTAWSAFAESPEFKDGKRGEGPLLRAWNKAAATAEVLRDQYARAKVTK